VVFGNIPGNVRKWSIALWPYHCLIVRNEANPPSAIVIVLREMDLDPIKAIFVGHECT
jgi:hypothetical protein